MYCVLKYADAVCKCSYREGIVVITFCDKRKLICYVIVNAFFSATNKGRN